MRRALVASAVLALPSSLRAQPVSAPSGVTYNRSDSIGVSGSVATPLLPPTAPPRSSVLARNLKVGAIAGVAAGLVASQFIYKGGCADVVRVDVRNPGVRYPTSCSETKQRLVFTGYAAVYYGAIGSALGFTLGLLDLAVGRPDASVATTPTDAALHTQNR